MVTALTISASRAQASDRTSEFSIMGGVDAGYASLAIAQDQLNELDKGGGQFTLKALGSYSAMGSNWVFDLGGGWQIVNVSGDITGRTERNLVRNGFAELATRYKFATSWQLGPFIDFGFGTDLRLAQRTVESSTTGFYPGFSLMYEFPRMDYPFLVGARGETSISIPNRQLWLGQLSLQVGFPVKGSSTANSGYTMPVAQQAGRIHSESDEDRIVRTAPIAQVRETEVVSKRVEAPRVPERAVEEKALDTSATDETVTETTETTTTTSNEPPVNEMQEDPAPADIGSAVPLSSLPRPIEDAAPKYAKVDRSDEIPIETNSEIADQSPDMRAVEVKVSPKKHSVRIYLNKEITNFPTDSDKLSPQGRKFLAKLARYLVKHRHLFKKIAIQGHSDIRGKLDYNMRLSRRRAGSVQRVMLAGGLPRNRMVVAGFGPKRPLDPHNNAKAWAKNRRVEIYFDGVKDTVFFATSLASLKKSTKASLRQQAGQAARQKPREE